MSARDGDGLTLHGRQLTKGELNDRALDLKRERDHAIRECGRLAARLAENELLLAALVKPTGRVRLAVIDLETINTAGLRIANDGSNVVIEFVEVEERAAPSDGSQSGQLSAGVMALVQSGFMGVDRV